MSTRVLWKIDFLTVLLPLGDADAESFESEGCERVLGGEDAQGAIDHVRDRELSKVEHIKPDEDDKDGEVFSVKTLSFLLRGVSKVCEVDSVLGASDGVVEVAGG